MVEFHGEIPWIPQPWSWWHRSPRTPGWWARRACHRAAVIARRPSRCWTSPGLILRDRKWMKIVDVYGMFMGCLWSIYIYKCMNHHLYDVYGLWMFIYIYISMMLNHNLCGLFSRKSLKKTWTLPDLLWTVVPEVGFHVLGHQLQKPAEPQRWLAMVFNMRLQQN